MDPSGLPLLSGDERSVTRVDRVDVPDFAVFLADGKGIRHFRAWDEITKRASG